MMNTDNGRSIKDAIGQIIHEGDRVDFAIEDGMAKLLNFS